VVNAITAAIAAAKGSRNFPITLSPANSFPVMTRTPISYYFVLMSFCCFISLPTQYSGIHINSVL